MNSRIIYCELCGQPICEKKHIKKNIVICSSCKGSTRLTVMEDGSVHSVAYPYELAVKKRPDLYMVTE